MLLPASKSDHVCQRNLVIYMTGRRYHGNYLDLVLCDASSSEPVVPAVHGLVVHEHHLEVAALLTRQ